MTSIAPLKVAGLMEFHVLETDPPRLRTYCISCSTEIVYPLFRFVAGFAILLEDGVPLSLWQSSYIVKLRGVVSRRRTCGHEGIRFGATTLSLRAVWLGFRTSSALDRRGGDLGKWLSRLESARRWEGRTLVPYYFSTYEVH